MHAGVVRDILIISRRIPTDNVTQRAGLGSCMTSGSSTIREIRESLATIQDTRASYAVYSVVTVYTEITVEKGAAMALTKAARDFILHWGEMGSRWGVNRTVAQVHALLYLAAE